MEAELREIDPGSADQTRDNPRRLMRALEIVRITGKPVEPPAPTGKPSYVGPEFVLMPDPESTRNKVRKRTDLMFQAGWIDEVASIMDTGLLETPTARQALGYPVIADWLKEGHEESDTDAFNQLKESIITATCRYAKRQRTWFRHQHPDAIQIPLSGEWQSAQVAETVLAHLQHEG